MRGIRIGAALLGALLLLSDGRRGCAGDESPPKRPKSDQGASECLGDLVSSVILEQLQRSNDRMLRALEVSEPIEERLIIAALANGKAGGAQHCTVNICLFRAASAATRKTLRASEGDLDVVLTRSSTNCITSPIAVVVYHEVFPRELRAEQAIFQCESTSWRIIEQLPPIVCDRNSALPKHEATGSRR
jgi:hypothetical protein